MPYDPADFPPWASHRTITTLMTGPACFTNALSLQEWIRDLLQGGFTGAERSAHQIGHDQVARA